MYTSMYTIYFTEVTEQISCRVSMTIIMQIAIRGLNTQYQNVQIGFMMEFYEAGISEVFCT